jgi:type IV pilus assembly protein PilB
LIDMGAKPFLVASAVQAILAQRLVRKLCVKCKKQYTPTETELLSVGLKAANIKTMKLYIHTGCPDCGNNGFRGRMGIYELMEMSPPLRELTFHQASTMKLREEAILSGGMTTLQQDGVRKILSGLTTIEEILRVTHAKD